MIVGALTRPVRFLARTEVLTLHTTAIARYGGLRGVRDDGLLDSALAMPEHGISGEYVHGVPFTMAAAYAFHLCQNHPFVDGNKRTAFAACVAFLRLNGWTLAASQEDATDRMLAVASGKMAKEELAEWLVETSRARPTIELREFFGSLRFAAIDEIVKAMPRGHGQAHQERAASMSDAMAFIPAIREAVLGAKAAEERGNIESAVVLRAHAWLLMAIHRIAEERGYEW